jgi:hypothetical protein
MFSWIKKSCINLSDLTDWFYLQACKQTCHMTTYKGVHVTLLVMLHCTCLVVRCTLESINLFKLKEDNKVCISRCTYMLLYILILHNLRYQIKCARHLSGITFIRYAQTQILILHRYKIKSTWHISGITFIRYQRA